MTSNESRREAAYETVQEWIVCPYCGSDTATVGCPGPQVRCPECGRADDTTYKYRQEGESDQE